MQTLITHQSVEYIPCSICSSILNVTNKVCENCADTPLGRTMLASRRKKSSPYKTTKDTRSKLR